MYFPDGNQIDLEENTLIQIFSKEQKSELNYMEGDVNIDTTKGGQSVVLKSQDATVEISSGTSVEAGSEQSSLGDPSRIQLQVLQGSANVMTANGSETITGGTSFLLGKEAESPLPVLAVTSPTRNQKLLNTADREIDVPINWTIKNLAEDTNFIIELANDSRFMQIEETRRFTARKANVSENGEVSGSEEFSLSNATWYWRVREANSEGLSVLGKVRVVDANAPHHIVPKQNTAFDYRTKLPIIRFMWEDKSDATAYLLEIADNSSMQNPVISKRLSSPSAMISTLQNGQWYWRVTPYYLVNNAGFISPSTPERFVINQRGDLSKPALRYPYDKGFVNTKGKGEDKASLYFSWKNEREASSYTLRISNNASLSNPILEKVVTENYTNIEPETVGINNGIWYWGVFQTDIEGNNSPVSNIRAFVAVDGELYNRTVYPPDGYTLATTLVPDTRFTWKSNIAVTPRFQVASDINFNNIIIDKASTQEAIKGESLPEGTWYWRIYGETLGIEYKTPPKRLLVKGPLGKPEITNLRGGTQLVIRPNMPSAFEWTTVEDAQYYQVKLYAASSNRLLFARSLIENERLELDLNSFSEGYYKVTVQAFVDETPSSSRRNGLINETNFELKVLKPVKLVSPADGVEYEGSQALLQPATLTWSTVEQPARSKLLVTTKPMVGVDPVEYDPESVVMEIDNPPTSVRLDPLYENQYYWTVIAYTTDNLAITALQPKTFKVGEIKPLEAVANASPETNTVLGTEYWSKNKKIEFTWSSVKDAQGYIFTIYNGRPSKDNKNAVLTRSLTKTSFTLTDLSVIDKGTYYWTVEPVTYYQEGKIFQHGKKEARSFKVDLPDVKNVKFRGAGTLYGK